MKILRFGTLIFLVWIVCFPAGRSSAADIRAGFAEQSITPKITETWKDANGDARYNPKDGDTFVDANGNGVFDAYWLAGFHNSRPANGVHDDIKALATVIDDGTLRIALVSLDAIGFQYHDVEELRSRIPAKWDLDQVVVASTHNHEVPDLMGLWGPSLFKTGVIPSYREMVMERAIAAIGDAVAAMRPVRLLSSDIAIDDHALVNDTREPMVIDPGVRMIRFVDKENSKTLGSIVSWANHPEVLWSENLEITADFVGYFRDGLANGLRYQGRLLGESGIGGIHIYFSGAVGGLMTTLPEHTIVDPVLPQAHSKPSHDKARALGYQLARWTLENVRKGREQELNVPRLQLAKETIRLPVANREFLLARLVGLMRRPVYPDFTVESEMNLIGIGDVRLLTIPGEIYPEIINGGIISPEGADFPGAPAETPPLRQAMGGRIQFILGLANDEVGYIIPKSQWDSRKPYAFGDEPQYGEGNSLGPDTAPLIHQTALRLIEKIAP